MVVVPFHTRNLKHANCCDIERCGLVRGSGADCACHGLAVRGVQARLLTYSVFLRCSLHALLHMPMLMAYADADAVDMASLQQSAGTGSLDTLFVLLVHFPSIHVVAPFCRCLMLQLSIGASMPT